jgi:hypothetical protein
MASTLAEEPHPSDAIPSTFNSDSVTNATAVRHSQVTALETTLHARTPVTASAAEVSNPEHPHHRHHRNIQDFELMETLGEGSYSTVHIYVHNAERATLRLLSFTKLVVYRCWLQKIDEQAKYTPSRSWTSFILLERKNRNMSISRRRP